VKGIVQVVPSASVIGIITNTRYLRLLVRPHPNRQQPLARGDTPGHPDFPAFEHCLHSAHAHTLSSSDPLHHCTRSPSAPPPFRPSQPPPTPTSPPRAPALHAAVDLRGSSSRVWQFAGAPDHICQMNPGTNEYKKGILTLINTMYMVNR